MHEVEHGHGDEQPVDRREQEVLVAPPAPLAATEISVARRARQPARVHVRRLAQLGQLEHQRLQIPVEALDRVVAVVPLGVALRLRLGQRCLQGLDLLVAAPLVALAHEDADQGDGERRERRDQRRDHGRLEPEDDPDGHALTSAVARSTKTRIGRRLSRSSQSIQERTYAGTSARRTSCHC